MERIKPNTVHDILAYFYKPRVIAALLDFDFGVGAGVDIV
jgi:hypothetical protein